MPVSRARCWLLALLAVLTAFPSFAASAEPPIACLAGLLKPDPILLSLCPQALCNDDGDCQSLCPSDPGSYCDLSSFTCVYPGGSGPGGSGCQSNAICTPARLCNDPGDCSACDGCTGYCASDGVCRVF